MTEGNMATLSIKESREFVIFQAFSQNDSYNAALDALEKYDRENPDRRIFASAEEKKAMRDSYLMFKEAERIISRGGSAPDYDNPQIMERLNTILRQQLPAVSREVMKSATASTAINKANVGRMMALHARNVKALGKKMLQQGKETVHEQARVGKSGIPGADCLSGAGAGYPARRRKHPLHHAADPGRKEQRVTSLNNIRVPEMGK